MKNKKTFKMALSLVVILILIYFIEGWFGSLIFFVGIVFGMEYMELLMTGRMFNKKSNTQLIKEKK